MHRTIRATPSGEFDLDTTAAATYFSLRWGMVAVAAALPLLLWFGGRLFDGCPLRDSLSAYYYTGMRDWFVGLLFAAAACLYLYKGLSDRENYLLNGAAVLAVGIAVNPPGWLPPRWFPTAKVSPHGICAVSFFLLIALACWLCQDDSLELNLIPARGAAAYRRKYFITGVALVALPLLAAVFNTFVFLRPFRSSVFWIEALGLWVFAFYWYTKSGELRQAMHRSLRRRA